MTTLWSLSIVQVGREASLRALPCVKASLGHTCKEPISAQIKRLQSQRTRETIKLIVYGVEVLS